MHGDVETTRRVGAELFVRKLVELRFGEVHERGPAQGLDGSGDRGAETIRKEALLLLREAPDEGLLPGHLLNHQHPDQDDDWRTLAQGLRR